MVGPALPVSACYPIIGIAGQADRDAFRQERAKGLSAAAGSADRESVVRQVIAELPLDARAEQGPERAVRAGDPDGDFGGWAGLSCLETVLERRDQDFLIERPLEPEIKDLFRPEMHVGGDFRGSAADTVHRIDPVQQDREIHGLCLLRDRRAPLQAVRAPDHVIDRAEAEGSHDLAELFRDEQHEVHDVFGLAFKTFPELLVLGRDAERAGVFVADAHHHTAQTDKGRGGETEFFRTEQGSDRHVPAAHQFSVCFQDDAEIDK